MSKKLHGTPSGVMRAVAAVAMLILSAAATGQVADNLKAFPAAGEGMVRHVLQLPKQADESAYKVELIAGKTVQVDGANRYFFAGRIEKETVKGWGYTLYRIGALGPMAGTLMAVDPAAPKVDRFVALGGEPYLIRYNSRLPVVVYAPAGVELRYRIWAAGAETKKMAEG